jgi:hypothetical protein
VFRRSLLQQAETVPALVGTCGQVGRRSGATLKPTGRGTPRATRVRAGHPGSARSLIGRADRVRARRLGLPKRRSDHIRRHRHFGICPPCSSHRSRCVADRYDRRQVMPGDAVRTRRLGRPGRSGVDGHAGDVAPVCAGHPHRRRNHVPAAGLPRRGRAVDPEALPGTGQRCGQSRHGERCDGGAARRRPSHGDRRPHRGRVDRYRLPPWRCVCDGAFDSLVGGESAAAGSRRMALPAEARSLVALPCPSPSPMRSAVWKACWSCHWCWL